MPDDDISSIRSMMSGVIGLRLRRLLKPLVQLKCASMRRRHVNRSRMVHVPAALSSPVIQIALQNPVLAAFGEATVVDLLQKSRFNCYEPGEILIYTDEPACIVGVHVVVSGTLTKVSAFYKDEPCYGPTVIGAEVVFSDEPSSFKLVADSVVDTYWIGYRDIRNAFDQADAPTAARVKDLCIERRRKMFAARFEQTMVFMRQSWITQYLSDTQVTKDLIPRLHARSYFPGDVIMAQGAPSEIIVCLRRGTISVQVDGEEMESCSGVCTVGETTVVFQERCAMSAVAKTIVDAWTLTRYDLEHLCENADFAAKLKEAAKQVRRAWLQGHKARGASVVPRALLSLPYMLDAPDELILHLSTVAEAIVFPVHAPIASVSQNCGGLYIIARGSAAGHHREVLDRYGVGGVIGATCALEHRNPSSICALSMVDAWFIPRAVFVDALRRFNLLEGAVAYAMSTLRTLEMHFNLCQTAPLPTPPSTQLPLALTSPAQRRIKHRPFLFKAPDAAVQEAPSPEARGAHHRVPVLVLGGHTTHDLEPDIGLGVSEYVDVLDIMRDIPTSRHSRFKSLVDLQAIMCPASVHRPSPIRRRRLDSAPEQPNADASATSTAAGAAPIPPPNKLALPPVNYTYASPPSSPGGRTKSKRPPKTRSVLPATFAVVQNAEIVGDWSPWLFVLLQRQPVLDGYLEGSLPGPLDVEPSKMASPLATPEFTSAPKSPPRRPKAPPKPPNPYAPSSPHGYSFALSAVEAAPRAPSPKLKLGPGESLVDGYEALIADILARGVETVDLTAQEDDNSGGGGEDKPARKAEVDYLQEEWDLANGRQPSPEPVTQAVPAALPPSILVKKPHESHRRFTRHMSIADDLTVSRRRSEWDAEQFAELTRTARKHRAAKFQPTVPLQLGHFASPRDTTYTVRGQRKAPGHKPVVTTPRHRLGQGLSTQVVGVLPAIHSASTIAGRSK